MLNAGINATWWHLNIWQIETLLSAKKRHKIILAVPLMKCIWYCFEILLTLPMDLWFAYLLCHFLWEVITPHLVGRLKPVKGKMLFLELGDWVSWRACSGVKPVPVRGSSTSAEGFVGSWTQLTRPLDVDGGMVVGGHYIWVGVSKWINDGRTCGNWSSSRVWLGWV